jgi:hypothetical protein
MLPIVVKLGLLAAAGLVGYEVWEHWSPTTAPVSPALTAGQSYTLTIRLKGPKAPTKLDANEAFKALKLQPFAVAQDPADANQFSATAAYVGTPGLAKALLPQVSTVRTPNGVFAITLPHDPVQYQAAAQTPSGKKAVAKAPTAIAGGYWRQPVHGGYRQGYSNAAYRHHHDGRLRWPWNIQ